MKPISISILNSNRYLGLSIWTSKFLRCKPTTALCVRMHRYWQSQIFDLLPFWKNLNVFRMREIYISSFWCLKVAFLTSNLCLFCPLFYTFLQKSIVKIHNWDFVFNSGGVPQVLGHFLNGPNLDEASESLNCPDFMPEMATLSHFLLFIKPTWWKL